MNNKTALWCTVYLVRAIKEVAMQFPNLVPYSERTYPVDEFKDILKGIEGKINAADKPTLTPSSDDDDMVTYTHEPGSPSIKFTQEQWGMVMQIVQRATLSADRP